MWTSTLPLPVGFELAFYAGLRPAWIKDAHFRYHYLLHLGLVAHQGSPFALEFYLLFIGIVLYFPEHTWKKVD